MSDLFAIITHLIAAWGNNYAGQLGNCADTYSYVPFGVGNLRSSNVKAIAGAISHSLALKDDGTVWAWGANYDGQLGDGTSTTRNAPVQVKDPSDPSGFLQGVQAIAGGHSRGQALKNDGTVWAWGWIGLRNAFSSNVPVQVGDPSDPSGFLQGVKAIAAPGGYIAGGFHTLALKNDGTVRAWGGNDWGQLGNGMTNSSDVPIRVEHPEDPSGFLQGVKAISGGGNHSLALKNNGTVWAWGRNQTGQLGLGHSNTNSHVPVQVKDPTDPSGFLQDVKALSGNGHGSLALKTAGTVLVWGVWAYGLASDVPIRVKDPTDPSGFLQGVQAIAGGTFHTLALKNDGTVRAWGYNAYGELGNGTYTTSSVPVTVSGLNGVTAIAGGSYYSLAK